MEGYAFDERIINNSDSDHILKTHFGLHVDEINNPLQNLIDSAGKIPYTAASIVLRDAYEQMYGFFDHQNFGAKRPLALVAKHPGEDVFTYSRSYNTIRRFIENDVGSVLNCSLMEFLSMPREYTRLVMEIITARRARKHQSAAEIERKLKQELNQQGKP